MVAPPIGGTLCFIANRYQWKTAQEAGLPAATDVVVTASSDIFFECRLQNRPSLSLWDFLPQAESLQHEAWAWELCDRLGEGLRTAPEEADLAHVIRHDALHVLLSSLNLSRALSRLLENHRSVRVRHFVEMEKLFYSDGGTRPEPDLFNFMVALHTRRRGIETRTMALSPSVREEIRLEAVPARLYAPEPGEAMPRDPVRALVFTQSISHAEQEPLFGALRRDWGDQVLTIMPEPTNPTGPYLSWAHLRRLPFKSPPAPDGDAVRKVLARAVSDLGLPDYATVIGTPEFAAFFSRGWREWLAWAATEQGIARLCDWAFRPACAVLPYDVEGAMRGMAREWTARGVPVLSVDHVGLALPCVEWRNRGATSHVAVWGRCDAEAHRRWRDPAARVIETGSMRRDLGAAAELGKRRGKQRATADARSTILIITAQYASDLMAYGGYTGTAEALSWWERLCALTVRGKAWNWRLKTHPRFDQDTFYRHVLSTYQHCLEPAPGDLVSALESADVMLLMANPSTSAAHAILVGVPVVYFKPPTTPGIWRSPLEEGGALVVSDFTELEKTLTRVTGDVEYRREILAGQRAFLERALVATGEASVEKVRRALDELMQAEAPTVAPDPAARWLLDMTMTVEYGMRGVWSWRQGFKKNLRNLAIRGRNLIFDHLNGLNLEGLADYFMNVTLLAIWRRPEQDRHMNRARPWLGWILWQVYRALPDSIRPPRGWIVPYLRRTLEEEAVLDPSSRFWRILHRWIKSPPGRPEP